MKRIIVLFLLLSCLAAEAADSLEIPAPLKAVILYRQSAELEHQATTFLPAGTRELIFEGISSQVNMKSIRIHSDASLTIVSVEFSADYLRPANPTGVLLQLQDSLHALEQAQSVLRVQMLNSRELLDLLQANRRLQAPAPGHSVEELAKLLAFYKSQSLELQTALEQGKAREVELNLRENRIRQQIQEWGRKNDGSSGILRVRVMNPLAATCHFRINYQTDAASWTPAYDIRVSNLHDPLLLDYRARIRQRTGIDWKQVKISLVTAVPDSLQEAPSFNPWFLAFADPMSRMQSYLKKQPLTQALEGRVAGAQLNEVVVTGYSVRLRGANSLDDQQAEPLYVVDGVPVSEDVYRRLDPAMIKSVQILREGAATSLYGSRASGGAVLITLKQGLDDYTSTSDQPLNLTYQLDLPYDIPGNGKDQSIQFREEKIAVDYREFTAPRQAPLTFLLAGIGHWESLQLLPGEANILLEGTYVGSTFIQPASTDDSLWLTLGRDDRVVVSRRKLEDFSSLKFLGSNKKQVLTFEISVKNNKSEPVSLRCTDQLPVSTNRDIEVELLEASSAVVDEKTGKLTWTIQLAPGELKKWTLSYSVRYPRDKVLDLY